MKVGYIAKEKKIKLKDGLFIFIKIIVFKEITQYFQI